MNATEVLFEKQGWLGGLRDSRCGVEEHLRERISNYLNDVPLETLVVLEQALALCEGTYAFWCASDLLASIITVCAEFNTPSLDLERIEAICGLDDFRQHVSELLPSANPRSIKKMSLLLKEAA